MKTQTEQGRTIRSAREELELGAGNVKALVSGWRQRLHDDPGSFHLVETEVSHTFAQMASHVMGGLLAEVAADDPSEEEIKAVRDKALQEGNPLKAPMRNYKMNVVLLSGLILCLRVLYLPSDKRKRDCLIAEGLLPGDAAGKGVHIELGKFGFGKGCSPGLQEDVSRLVCFYPSLELARKELSRKGIVKDIKQIRRIALDLGFGMLDVRRERIKQWKEGKLPTGEELRGKKVAVAVDGGRVRFRKVIRKGKKGKRTKWVPEWREPKVLIIYIMGEDGRKEAKSACWIDGTFQKADQVMELLAMHLHRLGAKNAETIEFVSDGAEWIWNRIDWVTNKVGIDKNNVIKTLDFWHAAHHISLTLERMGIKEDERKKTYRYLRQELRRGRWKAVVEELEKQAVMRNLAKGHEAYQGIVYLRKHGQSKHLQYLRCKRIRITRGSGAIESCIRRVINLRLKGNGIFWNEENAEAVMQMRANLLSEQWDKEVAATRERWKTGGGKNYKWEAEEILKSVKLENEEADQMLKTSEISVFPSKVA